MYSILVDITKCTGCEKCVSACVKTNNLDPARADYDRVVSKDGLSSSKYLSIIDMQDDRYARKSCMHCLEPGCVTACLVGGLTKSPEGPVVYDPDKCIGCRYCMLSCNFHIPRYEWEKTKPLMRKCEMCYSKVKGGEIPACVANCPNGALAFGERDELLKKAKNIINASGGRYINKVWGEHEMGGTCVLYISDVDLEKIGWPASHDESVAEVTEPLIEKNSCNWFVRGYKPFRN